MEHTTPSAGEGKAPQLRIAIIGGGIFGTSIAAELGATHRVSIFEKSVTLLAEGTYANCFRHHMGYHYPRSDETVKEILSAKEYFEEVYGAAIIDTYPTYYGLEREHSRVDANEFLAFCERNRLPYEEVVIDRTVLSVDAMSLCIKVPEPSYHYETLKKLVEERLAALPNINVCLGNTVRQYALNACGTKTLRIVRVDGECEEQNFDVVINATYAGINQFSADIGFSIRPIRVDLTEELIISLPIAPISVTVIDGPFATLISTGNKNEFVLYHAKESIRDRYAPEDGLPKGGDWPTSNRERIISESAQYFPILKEAKVIESRFALRAVRANHEHDDSRVIDVVEHGNNCFSVLSGKILTSVASAMYFADKFKQKRPVKL
jgi:hypothetical protein